MSSYIDKDGKQKVEKYRKAACGDYTKDVRITVYILLLHNIFFI